MRDRFVHLHTHSHSSGFDGFGTEKQFANRVAEMGQSALSLTEHGTVRGLLTAQRACDEAGIKFIPGVEAYLCDDMSLRGLTTEEKKAIKKSEDDPDVAREIIKKAQAARRDRDHITIWAMNETGLRNLYRLTSMAWTQGFHYKPRLDLPTIINHGEGLIVSTGCPGGVVTSPIRRGDFDAALGRFERLADAFGDRLYIEVMPHPMPDCPNLQNHLAAIAREYGANLVATQDAHYPTVEDASSQEVMLCIHTGQCVADPERFSAKAFGRHEFYLRTREEMVGSLLKNTDLSRREIEAACDATLDFADRCDVRVEPREPGEYLAAPELPVNVGDYNTWLAMSCLDGYEERFGLVEREEYTERLNKELRVLADKGFARYMMTVADIIDHCASAGIRVGPGRGSAAGSLVSYLLGITKVDPIRHDLSFERFIAPGRADLPDIDIDVQHDRRGEVIEYLAERYGDDHVSHISTNITMRGRGALRDVGRAFDIPMADTVKVSSTVAAIDDGEGLKSAFERTDVGRKYADTYPDAADAAMNLEGQLRAVGVHPAGIVVSSRPITDVAPLESRSVSGSKKRVSVIAYDMEDVERCGLVKVDLLGLKAISALAIAIRESGMDDIDDVPLDDKGTLQAFTDSRFTGVFQFDSASSRHLCRDFEFKRFGDIAAITALNRPGPMQTGLADQFLERSKTPGEVPSVHPIYDAHTRETHGVLIYQEQVVALARDLGGYTAGEADAFRKMIAKKKGVTDERQKFVQGAVSNGMEPVDAEKLFDSIVGFGGYAFNKSHAYAYGLIAYQSMYLKVHHPDAFFAALLAIRSKTSELVRIANEAIRCGIPVRPPDVNASKGHFTLGHDEFTGGAVIVGSTSDIKGIGKTTAEGIAKAGPFSDLRDFYAKTRSLAKGRVTLSTFKALSETTALRSVYPRMRVLNENVERIWKGLQALNPDEDDSSTDDEFIRGLGVDVNVDEYTEDEIIKIASARYRMFRGVSGRGEFESIYDKLCAKTERPIVTPDMIIDCGLGGYVVCARLNDTKIFSDKGRGRSNKLSLMSFTGDEIVARASSDVLSRHGTAMGEKGEIVVCIVHSREGRGGETRYEVDALWLAEDMLADELTGLKAEVMRPTKTNPANPMVAMNEADIAGNKRFVVEGTIVRIRKHKDKKDRPMRTVGLLGSAGYVRFFVFASRIADDIKAEIKYGRKVEAHLDRISVDAACLSRKPVIRV